LNFGIIDDVQVLILLIVVAMRKRVELVAALFREAGKSVHAMPMLLIQPLWTLLALCALCAGWAYAALWIESAGQPTRAPVGTVIFQKDTYLQVSAIALVEVEKPNAEYCIDLITRSFDGTISWPLFGYRNSAWPSRTLSSPERLLNGFSLGI
jgi:hypothetical protein